MSLRMDLTIPAGTFVSGLFPVDGVLPSAHVLAGAVIRVGQVRWGGSSHEGRADSVITPVAYTADGLTPVCELASVKFMPLNGATAGAAPDQAYAHLKTLAEYAGAVDC